MQYCMYSQTHFSSHHHFTIGHQWMKAKMMGALGVQSSIDNEEEKKKEKTNEKKEGWAAVRQASQESKNEPLTQEEAALLIQSCKG